MNDKEMMGHRKAVKNYLIQAGFKNPQLYHERLMHNTYASYWGDSFRRVEAYQSSDKSVTAYELAFIGKQ